MDDEEALIGVLGAIVVIGYILFAAVCKTIEWLSQSIGFTEFIAWSVIIIVVLSGWKVTHFFGKNKH